MSDIPTQIIVVMYLKDNMEFLHRNIERSMQKVRNKIANYLERLKPGGIQSTIMVAFSIISVSIMLLTGIVMYMRFSNLSRQEMIKSTQKLMEQSKESMEDYLMNMRQISDAAYYSVIKESDFLRSQKKFKKECSYYMKQIKVD